MWNTLFVLALLGGCGRLGFDATQGDGGGGNGTIGGHPISAQRAYLKGSNTERDDLFGSGIALSADGTTLAVGADDEGSIATGIGGNQKDNSAPQAGAVYVFVTSGTTWVQQAYAKASNTEALDGFGNGVALSADGNTLMVSAIGESSSATGINGDQTSNGASFAGAVYVFSRSNATWTQQAYLKASNPGSDDWFGSEVALSGDGNTLAVSATREDSAATGIGGNQVDNNATDSGAVYVFARSGTTWTQQAYVKASNTSAMDTFGPRSRCRPTGERSPSVQRARTAPRRGSAATRPTTRPRVRARPTCSPAPGRRGASKRTSRRRTPSPAISSARASRCRARTTRSRWPRWPREAARRG